MSLIGPTLGVQQVGSYLGYTSRDANVVAKAAFDPLAAIAVSRIYGMCGAQPASEGGQGSSLMQPRLAQPVDTMLGILGTYTLQAN